MLWHFVNLSPLKTLHHILHYARKGLTFWSWLINCLRRNFFFLNLVTLAVNRIVIQDGDEGCDSKDYTEIADEISNEKFLWLGTDKISHEEFLCPKSSYFGSQLDSDSRQFIDVDEGNETMIVLKLLMRYCVNRMQHSDKTYAVLKIVLIFPTW